MTTTQTFETALADYLADIQKATDKDFETNYPRLFNSELHPKYLAQPGKKWVKIVRADAAQKSVFCFVDPQTGDLYKAATWNAPAKGIRGNIYESKRPINGGQFYRI
jgi:hypothetical protein